MLKYQGTIQLSNDGLRIIICEDFCRFYRWLIERNYHYLVKTSLSRYNNHITIVNKKIHDFKFTDNLDKLRKYHNLVVEFDVDTYIYLGGRTFTNFYMKVNLPLIAQIKEELGIIEVGFLGAHLTLCSTKAYGDKLPFKYYLEQEFRDENNSN